ncbi:MAG: copper chaperone PCu(A)C [Chloroflexi bacterium OHK40]
MHRLCLLLVLVASAMLTACGSATPRIAVTEPWVRAAVATGTGSSAATPMAGTDSSAATPMAGMEHSSGMMEMGSTSAAYMTLVNSGSAPDRLLSASTDAARTVELHETTMVDNVMRMAPVAGGIEVPANGQAELKPGGLHVMLIGLNRDLNAGDTVRLTLTFERAGTITVDAPVRQP